MYDNPEIVPEWGNNDPIRMDREPQPFIDLPDPILSLYNKPDGESIASKILKQAESETQKALDTLDKFGRIVISYFPIYSKDRHPVTGEELDGEGGVYPYDEKLDEE